MLATVGVARVDDLFQDIPAKARLTGPLTLPHALTEQELLGEIHRLARANRNCDETVCFLGAGTYDHFIPSVVPALAMQSEFLTAYTPYQAETAQGALQIFYEYQTLICQLTGMDVSNASLYDGSTAVAEAVLMARAVNGRRKVIASGAVHPEVRQVLATYLRELPIDLVEVPAPLGRTRVDELAAHLDEQTCAVLVQNPNFFGVVEPLDALSTAVHDAGGLMIAAVDPISCGLLRRPGDLGADIAVGDGQPLGLPMAYGGPTLGFMACREKYMRKLPGRLVGATTDRSGRRAFCLTLQTREQHIRRERATSNICTNQGLLAIHATVYLSVVGPHGLNRIATLCLQRSHETARRIAGLDGFEPAFDAPFFKEFAVRTTKDIRAIMDLGRNEGILPGVPLRRWYPDLDDVFMVAVTEKRTPQQIDRLIDLLERA